MYNNKNMSKSQYFVSFQYIRYHNSIQDYTPQHSVLLTMAPIAWWYQMEGLLHSLC
nr:MAG TPA_asm: hypothetical protein [Caudoviricetes sp.]